MSDTSRAEDQVHRNGIDQPPRRKRLHRFDLAMPAEMYAEYMQQSSYLRHAYAAWWSDPRRKVRASHRDAWPAFLMGWWMSCETAHAALLALTDGPTSAP